MDALEIEIDAKYSHGSLIFKMSYIYLIRHTAVFFLLVKVLEAPV